MTRPSRIAELEETIARAQAELKIARSRKRAACESCGRATEVRRLTYIQTLYYVEPYSCTGGDYWAEGEGRFECPKCGRLNRLYQRPEITKMKWHFGSVTKEHKR